jgi:hypothetical protein
VSQSRAPGAERQAETVLAGHGPPHSAGYSACEVTELAYLFQRGFAIISASMTVIHIY